MTDEEKAAERIKCLASAVYREMHEARRGEDFVRTVAGRHGDHPAFLKYMREMYLTEVLEEFLSRPVIKNG